MTKGLRPESYISPPDSSIDILIVFQIFPFVFDWKVRTADGKGGGFLLSKVPATDAGLVEIAKSRSK